ncbi:protein of unknown function (plasmid) [Pararobbsia alpina]
MENRVPERALADLNRRLREASTRIRLHQLRIERLTEAGQGSPEALALLTTFRDARDAMQLYRDTLDRIVTISPK